MKERHISIIAAIGIAVAVIIALTDFSFGRAGAGNIGDEDRRLLMGVLAGVMSEAGVSFVTAGYVDWFVALDKTSREPVLFIYCTEQSIKRAEEGVVRLLREAEGGKRGLVWKSEIRLIAGLVSTVFYVGDNKEDEKQLSEHETPEEIRWIPVQIITPCGNVLLRTLVSGKGGYNVFEIAEIFHKKALAVGLDKWSVQGDDY